MGDVIRGPWPAPPPPPTGVRWRRGRPPAPEAVRQHCAECRRPFHPGAWVPADLLCGDCRDAAAEAAADAYQAGLFDPDP